MRFKVEYVNIAGQNRELEIDDVKRPDESLDSVISRVKENTQAALDKNPNYAGSTVKSVTRIQ